MSLDLKKLIMEKVSSGLKRASLHKCSQWAETYRMMAKPFPGPWRFKHHPWLLEMHDSKAEENVGQKAAQMGFTEWALNTTFFKIDVEGVDCLYVLPSDGDASDFSAGRFDPALESSTHLRGLFSDVRNVGHKRAGQNNLYVRGSRSRSQLKSIPCGFLVFDEVDEMVQKNIPLAMERASGQLSRQILKISTPTREGFGINLAYQDSTQEHFFFICPHCGKLTELLFPDCLVITAEWVTDQKIKESYLKCKECGQKLDHTTKSEWLSTGRFVPAYADRDIRGFTVSQLYSSADAGTPKSLAIAALKAQRDPTDATEFFNSKLGQPYSVEGARVDDTDFIKCTGDYRKGVGRYKPVTMGVDVGKYLHIEIDEWVLAKNHTPGLDINDEATCRLIYEGTCEKFEDLDKLWQQYGVFGCVVDRHPETRAAYQFATRFWGRVLLCMYGRGLYGKQVQLGSKEERTITVDRTSWLDLSLGRFKNRTIALPIDLSEDYRRHVKEPERRYEKDSDGNPVGRYVNINDDHFAHARNYSEIALPLAVSLGRNQDITQVY